MDKTKLHTRLEKLVGRPLEEEQGRLLEAHLDYVLEQNKLINLTSITDREEGSLLHIEDSAAACSEVEEAPEGALVDIGSGAGYPGIPLAILTRRTTSLLEATTKKAQVLNRFISENGLEGILNVLNCRAEEAAKEVGGRFSVATARALSSLPSIMELAAPLLKDQGVLIAYKANLQADELQRAKALERRLGLTVTGLREIVLSDQSTKRVLVSFQKTGEPQISLPRRNGLAQRHPLA